MRNRLLYATLLLLGLQCLAGHGAQDPLSLTALVCQKAHRDISVRRSSLAKSTADHAQLTEVLQRMSLDPLMPLVARRVLHEAIETQGSQIKELTTELREALGFSDGDRGHYVFDTNIFPVKDKTTGGSVPHLLFAEDPFIVPGTGPKRAPSIVLETKNEFATTEETLIHELAHIRLMAFLDRTFQGIASKGNVPEWALTKYQGKYFVSLPFYHYLAERYAYEVQYQTLKATIDSSSKWKDTPHPIFGNVRTETEAAVRRRIVEHLKREYPETADPRLRQFDDMPVASILLGKSPEGFLLRP